MSKLEELRVTGILDLTVAYKTPAINMKQPTKEATELIDSLISAVREDEREKERKRIYAYVDDANNPYSMYIYTERGFYLRATEFQEFVASGREWVNPKYATPKKPVLFPKDNEKAAIDPKGGEGMKLQVGHVYVDGHGRRVRVICTDRRDGMLQFCVVGLVEQRADYEGIECYRLDGRCIAQDDEEHDWDIVREVTE